MAEETTATNEASAPETESDTNLPQADTPTVESLQAELATKDKIISDLRKENGKARITAKTQAANEARATVVDDIAKALGIKEDTAPTVETLQETIATLTEEKAQAEATSTQAEMHLAVYKAAKAAGGDPDLLLDSQSFTASLADVEPTDTDTLKTKIQEWVAANPKYAAGTSPARSTIEHTSGPSAITLDEFKALDHASRVKYARSNPEAARALFKQF